MKGKMKGKKGAGMMMGHKGKDPKKAKDKFKKGMVAGASKYSRG